MSNVFYPCIFFLFALGFDDDVVVDKHAVVEVNPIATVKGKIGALSPIQYF